MRDTPRTDAAELDAHIGVSCFDDTDLTDAFSFARKLEREIFEWKKISDDWMNKAFENLGHLASALAREEALREALEAITSEAEAVPSWESRPSRHHRLIADARAALNQP